MRVLRLAVVGIVVAVTANPAIAQESGGAVVHYDVAPDPALPWRRGEIPIELEHAYTLSELIDLAQRVNPTTRIAWEQARQAALEKGLVDATYLPELSAEVLGGVQHAALPLPKLLAAGGNMMANTEEVVPSLVLKWLLFDFGRRDGLSEAAKQMATVANVGFTAAHQKLIFDVSKAYFALDAEHAQVRVAESAVKSAQILQDAAEAKYARGLGTVTEVATTRRGTAKARYDLEQAKANDNDAYHGLLEAMGLTPTLKMTIASSEGRALPRHLADDADGLIQWALTRRPDVIAALAKVRAGEASLAAAESAYYPTIGLESFVANTSQGMTQHGVSGPDYSRVNQPTEGIMLSLKLPLYDGGTRERRVSLARSRKTAAEEELTRTQDETVRQVARSGDSLKSALAQYDAAQAFVAAANKEFDSALEAYRQGVGTLITATTADTQRVQAESAQAQAYAGVLAAAATLAFTTGKLTSSEALDNPE